MQTLNELQELRAALLAEREELEASLPDLRKAHRNAPTDWNYLAMPVGSPEADAAHKAVTEAEARIRQITCDVEGPHGLDAKIAHLMAHERSDEIIAKAKADGLEADGRISRLEASSARINDRLAEIAAAEEQTAELAAQAENEAAQAMAKATASGDAKSAKAASGKMEAAIEAKRAAKEQVEANTAIVSALKAEVAALENQLKVARRQADEAYETGRRATCVKLGAEWDRLAMQLKEVGANLVKQGGHHALESLKLTTFQPVFNSTITIDDLKAVAREQAA